MITEAEADRLADILEGDDFEIGEALTDEDLPVALRRLRGRPSLTGAPAKSPQLTVRVEPDTRDRLASLAERQGRNVGAVLREAIDRYLAEAG